MFDNEDDGIDEISELFEKCRILHHKSYPDSSLDFDSLNLTGQLSHGTRAHAKGHFADVYRGRMNDSRKAVAVKMLRLPSFTPSNESIYQNTLLRFFRELNLWAKLDHLNIARLLGFTMFNGNISLISLWHQNGNLVQYLQAQPSASKQDLMLDVAEGTLYLHTCPSPLVHGDLKGANVLVCEIGIARLADFGISKQIDDINRKTGFTTTSGVIGTIPWMAPELDLGSPLAFPCDVYSCGGVLLEICCPGKMPYHYVTQSRDMILAKDRGEVPDRSRYPEMKDQDALWQLMCRCWGHDAETRPSMRDVVEALYQQFRLKPRAPSSTILCATREHGDTHATDIGAQTLLSALGLPPPPDGAHEAENLQHPLSLSPPGQPQKSPLATSEALEQPKYSEQEPSTSRSDPFGAQEESRVREPRTQSSQAIRPTIGEVEGSISSLAVEMDVSAAGGDDTCDDLVLQQDSRGRYYYAYRGAGSDGRSSESLHSASPDASTSLILNSNVQLPGDERSFSQSQARVTEMTAALAKPSEAIFHEQVQELGTPIDDPANCSECSAPLDCFRYTCLICGPISTGRKGKGKAKAKGTPPLLLSPTSSDNEVWRRYDLPQGSSAESSARSVSIHGSSSSGYPPTAITTPGTSNRRLSNASETSDSGENGYELCSTCIYTAGVTHAREQASIGSELSTALPSSPWSFRLGRSIHSESSISHEPKATRHAFIERIWDGLVWIDVEQGDSAACSICDNPLGSGKYRCASCEQFNLCQACYSRVHEIHPSHTFLVTPVKPLTKLESPREHQGQDPEELSLLHPGVSCHHCWQDIVGARYHCVTCESVDICHNCNTAALPGNLTSVPGQHDASHLMIKVPYPVESAEVALVSERARVLWLKQGVVAPEIVNQHSQNPLDHGIQCDSCIQYIVGTRYQCARCSSLPKAYNLCSECEKESHFIHPGRHIFLKFNRRVDHPFGCEGPLIPDLYKESYGGAWVSENPNDLTHSATYCDWCMLLIHGIWYRCLYCNKDMCHEHEQLHHKDHVCIVLKSRVDYAHLRLVFDSDDPDRSAPLIPAVYDTI